MLVVQADARTATIEIDDSRGPPGFSRTRMVAEQATLALMTGEIMAQPHRGGFDPPFPAYIPLENRTFAGETYGSLAGEEGRYGLNPTFTRLGAERVHVPAGTFDAVRMHLVQASSKSPDSTVSDFWFVTAVKAPIRSVGPNQTLELLSYHVST